MHLGFVYKLKNDNNNNCYIGSTKNIIERLYKHRCDKNAGRFNKRYEGLGESFNCKILSTIFYSTRKELLKEELKYIKLENKENLLNIQTPLRTRKQWKLDNKERININRRKNYKIKKNKELEQDFYKMIDDSIILDEINI